MIFWDLHPRGVLVSYFLELHEDIHHPTFSFIDESSLTIEFQTANLLVAVTSHDNFLNSFAHKSQFPLQETTREKKY